MGTFIEEQKVVNVRENQTIDTMESSHNQKLDGLRNDLCNAPNPAPGVKRGCHLFIFFYKLITFKLVQLYNVKHLTCTIFCSIGLQNIYKLHIWKCSTFTIFTLFTKTKHIQK